MREDCEPKTVRRKDFRGLCPCCKGIRVDKGMLKFDSKAGGSSNEHSKADTAAWYCYECGRFFYVKD